PALLLEVADLRRVPAIGPAAAVDDHRDAGVVGVVRDELVVELRLELTGDHAIDHGLIVSGDQRRAISGTTRPSSARCAFQSPNAPSSSSGSCPRSARRTGCADSGVTRYWYQEISQATVTTMSGLTPESGTIDTRGSPRLFAIPPTVRRNCEALKRSA